MGWKIKKDHTYKQYEELNKRIEVPDCTGKERNYKGGRMQVRTFDDDGTLYYTAWCDDEESAENFHNWSEYDSGSVRSQFREKANQKWEEFIS